MPVNVSTSDIDLRDLHVVVVDDSESHAALVRAYLRTPSGRDYHMTAATSLRGGIELMAHTAIDCVLLDLTLPDSDGFDGLSTIRAAHPDLPVVVLTGSEDDAAGEQALQRGAQDYITKSDMTPRILRRSIARARRERSSEPRQTSPARCRPVSEPKKKPGSPTGGPPR
jgi:CheY-like chemotaxis protein